MTANGAAARPERTAGGVEAPAAAAKPVPRGRLIPVALAMLLLFSGIGAQMLRLAFTGRSEIRLQSAEPIVRVHARPEIVDRQGRIIATDVDAASLYADPAMLLDLDEVIEKLTLALPMLDETELRRSLGDRNRRFAWIKRGMAPVEAQRVHELGLPGLAFRREPKRVYPAGSLTGHIVGQVNVDNRGQAGIERYIDETLGLDAVSGAAASRLKQVRLSLDLGVQHSVAAMRTCAAYPLNARRSTLKRFTRAVAIRVDSRSLRRCGAPKPLLRRPGRRWCARLSARGGRRAPTIRGVASRP